MKARGNLAGRIAALPIRAYQRWISPFKPPTCRFHPSCSAYAREALELHGFWRGTGLGVWRILRCQPFCKPGFDPVPGSTRHRATSACESRADVDTPAHEPPSSDQASSLPSRSPR
ncbi:MAG: membrane protein insertion efficiency factor YidD [Planctomycetota bacterium]